MFRFALALATAEGANLAVTWSDCGAKHATVSDVSPKVIHTGATETITGTGTVDEDVTSAHFTSTVSALGTKLTDCSGDATTDIVCTLPMGVGKITVKALSFPLSKGTVHIPVEVQTSSIIPPSLANVDVHVAAVEQNGEDVICLDVHTAKQMTSDDAFEAFKAQFGKVYNGDEDEHKATFEANVAANEAHNAKNLGWTLGINQFTDMTPEQYKVAAGLGYKAPTDMMGALPYLGEHKHDGSELAATVNWVTQGAVTPIKDQGQCGSCWAFSTTGSTESAWQISTGNLLSVSEQQLVDCATATSSGCQGGSMAGAIQYEATTDMASEASYPYKAVDGTCKSSFTTAIPRGGVTGYKSVGSFWSGASKSDMQSAVQQQPISIAIEADQYAFQAYTGGILASGCGTSLDHGVLAVGYSSAQDYWLVKNSWGTSWGDAGYIKISSASNVCGVLSQPVYPQVSGSVAV